MLIDLAAALAVGALRLSGTPVRDRRGLNVELRHVCVDHHKALLAEWQTVWET